MSKQQVQAATGPDPHSWRAGAVRVLANALVVLLAFDVVTLVAGAAQTIVTGAPPPLPPVQLVLVVTVYIVVRWIVVLPALLPVLAGLEYVARRAPHARVLTAIVAFAPMVLWELTQSGDTSGQSLILGLTAVLFAVLARLPARLALVSDAALPETTPSNEDGPQAGGHSLRAKREPIDEGLPKPG